MIRWVVLIILTLCVFAYMYAYDTPVAIQEQLQNEPYNLSNIQYNLLFTAYAWPNVVFPIVLGVLTDVIGVNKMLWILFFGMFIGNAIFLLGVELNEFSVMLTGRCVYGINAESFCLANLPLLYVYFIGKELSFAIGFNLSFARLGSAVNDVLTYKFYQMKGVVFAISMCVFVLQPVCLILLTMLLVYRIYYEPKTDDNIDKNHKQSIIMTSKLKKKSLIDHNVYNELDMSATNDISIASKYDSFQSNNDDNDNNNQYSMYSIPDPDDNDVIFNNMEEFENDIEEDNKFRFSDVYQFDARYWLLVVNCAFQYACVVPWLKIGGSYMQVKFGYDQHKANQYLMIPYLVSAIGTPLIGFFVDKLGHRCELLLVATVTFTVSHYALGWLKPTSFNNIDDDNQDLFPLIGLIGLGLGYSVFCAVIWPSLALSIPPNMVGTGYGIPTGGYNLILGLFFLLVGLLTRNDEDLEDVSQEKYTDVEWFLLSTCICSIVTTLMLWHIDRADGNVLGLPSDKYRKSTMQSHLSYQ